MYTYITQNQRLELKKLGYKVVHRPSNSRLMKEHLIINEVESFKELDFQHREDLAYSEAAKHHEKSGGTLCAPKYTAKDLAYSLIALQEPLIVKTLKSFDFTILAGVVEFVDQELMRDESDITYPKEFLRVRNAAIQVTASKESNSMQAIAVTIRRMKSFLHLLRNTSQKQSYRGSKEALESTEAEAHTAYSVLGLLRLFVAENQHLNYEDIDLKAGTGWLTGMLNVHEDYGNAHRMFNLPQSIVHGFALELGSSWVDEENKELNRIPIMIVARELELSFSQVADLLDMYWFEYGTDSLIINIPNSSVSLSLIKNHLEAQAISDTMGALGVLD